MNYKVHFQHTLDSSVKLQESLDVAAPRMKLTARFVLLEIGYCILNEVIVQHPVKAYHEALHLRISSIIIRADRAYLVIIRFTRIKDDVHFSTSYLLLRPHQEP